MSELSLKGKLSMFSYDIALVNFEDNTEKLKQIVETNLRHITERMEKNGYQISVCMPIVTCYSQLQDARYNFKIHKCNNNTTKYCCNSIKIITSFKYLGDWRNIRITNYCMYKVFCRTQ